MNVHTPISYDRWMGPLGDHPLREVELLFPSGELTYQCTKPGCIFTAKRFFVLVKSSPPHITLDHLPWRRISVIARCDGCSIDFQTGDEWEEITMADVAAIEIHSL